MMKMKMMSIMTMMKKMMRKKMTIMRYVNTEGVGVGGKQDQDIMDIMICFIEFINTDSWE